MNLFNQQFFRSNVFLRNFGSIAGNGSRLGDVAEIEGQMFNFVQKFNRRTELEFSTSAAILPNRCWA